MVRFLFATAAAAMLVLIALVLIWVRIVGAVLPKVLVIFDPARVLLRVVVIVGRRGAIVTIFIFTASLLIDVDLDFSFDTFLNLFQEV